MPPAEGEHAAVDGEDRTGIGILRIDGARLVVHGDRQPGLCVREAREGHVAGPGHRRAAAVAATELGPEADAVGIAQVLERHIGFGQAELFALVEADRTTQRQEHREIEPDLRAGQAPARGVAFHVVVGEGPAGPALGRALLELVQHLGDAVAVRGLVAREELEGVAHVDAPARGIGAHHLHRALGVAHLAHRADGRVFVHQRAHPLEELQVLRPALVVEVILPVVGIDLGRGGIVALVLRQDGVVAQRLVVKVEVDRVEAEAVDAAVEPEPRHVDKLVPDLGLVEVEVRLLLQEVVHVVLLALAIPFPGGTAEDREPVVRRRAVGFRLGPDVPVGLGIVAARPAFLEPAVLVGGVAEHEVDHHPEAEFVRPRDQRVEIAERAEHRVDVAVVGDVVAEVEHRRPEEGRDPDRVDPERGDVGQALDDPGEIADPVAVRILEAAGIDLVDHPAAPPVRIDRQRRAFLQRHRRHHHGGVSPT